MRSTNPRINSGIQSEATNESNTEETDHSNNSHTKKFSKSKRKVRNKTKAKSTNKTSELPHINHPNPEEKIVTSTPLRPQTPENTIPKMTASPKNNNILSNNILLNSPQNNNIPSNNSVPQVNNIGLNEIFASAFNNLADAIRNPQNNNSSNVPQNYSRPVICKLEPKEFDGTVAEAADWLQNFNMIAENNQWNDQQRYRTAKVKMIGNAKFWCLNTFKNHNDPSFTAYTTEAEPTWQEFCDKFLAHFRPAGCEYILEDQLKLLTKEDSETYTEYAMRFLTRTRQANALMADDKIVFLFKRTLLRDPIISSITNIKTLDSILEALRNFDEIQSIDRIIKKPTKDNANKFGKFNRNHRKSDNSNTESDSSLKRNHNNRNSNNRNSESDSSPIKPKPNRNKNRKSSAPELVRCFNCSRKGHTRKSCLDPQNLKLQEEWRQYFNSMRKGDSSAKKPSASNVFAIGIGNSELSQTEDILDQIEAKDEHSVLQSAKDPFHSSSALLISSVIQSPQNFNKSRNPTQVMRREVTLNDQKFTAMIDCGSEISLISTKTFRSLNPRPKYRKWPHDSVISVDESNITPDFITEPLSFRVGCKSYKFEFGIKDNTCASIIIGMDILQNIDAVLHIKKRLVYIEDDCITKDPTNKSSPQEELLLSSASIIISSDKLKSNFSNNNTITTSDSKYQSFQFSKTPKDWSKNLNITENNIPHKYSLLQGHQLKNPSNYNNQNFINSMTFVNSGILRDEVQRLNSKIKPHL